MDSLSVMICTHNPRRDYLGRVLDALAAQTLPRDRWELLVIDNKSTLPVANLIDLSWHPCSRVVREETLGATAARLCGIREMRGDLFVLVDDDSVLDPGYLENALELAQAWPQLGAFGAGKIALDYERTPDMAVRPLMKWLGLRDDEVPSWSNSVRDFASIPAGLGLCGRREVAREFEARCARDALARGLGARGSSILGGEDVLLASAAHARGTGWGCFPQLRLTHLIPGWRVELAYLARLIEGRMTAHHVLRYVLLGKVHEQAAVVRWARFLYHNARLARRGDGAGRAAFNAAHRGEKAALALIRAERAAQHVHKVNAAYAKEPQAPRPAQAPRAPAWRDAPPFASRLP